MSAPYLAALRLLDRMLAASQEHVDTQLGAVQRVARELASISASYHSHVTRSALQSPLLAAIEAPLEDASTSLSRTHFDLQQRMLGDVQALQQLIALVATLQRSGGATTPLHDGIDAYCAGLEREHRLIAETLGALTLQLRLLANNIEIAAAHAGGEDVTAPIDLFCAMSTLLRGLADRLRGSTGDLRIFEQTQNGHAESLRSALAAPEEGTAA
jgi:hypothetical protein